MEVKADGALSRQFGAGAKMLNKIAATSKGLEDLRLCLKWVETNEV